ncbi:peptidase M23 [Novimethylophilus kurashikiensis]|uniref:Peptidase M23 n=1 Tax=Novimethylophilus kurashikiensis TaxID=1825523 RepID=A0A2R5F8B1_9PROT|nr:M23 family metallopeptidase [Novimethylophilus kurashikiensis]GBG14482.1 peptidase M23 [Novimethylophilus kurashikiensis]
MTPERWESPLKLQLVPTVDSLSFLTMPQGTTGLPLSPHPGAFGVRRRFHTHEGVDLYAPEGTEVFAVEAGEVIAVRQFTGPELGHDWWLPTYGVWIEGASGVVLYGEIEPHLAVGQQVMAGERVGTVLRVLKEDKGRPTSMLHLELRDSGNTADIEWLDNENRPAGLLDPTPYLLDGVVNNQLNQ